MVGGEIGVLEECLQLQMGELGAMGIFGSCPFRKIMADHNNYSPRRRPLTVSSCLQTPSLSTPIRTPVDPFLYLH